MIHPTVLIRITDNKVVVHVKDEFDGPSMISAFKIPSQDTKDILIGITAASDELNCDVEVLVDDRDVLLSPSPLEWDLEGESLIAVKRVSDDTIQAVTRRPKDCGCQKSLSLVVAK